LLNYAFRYAYGHKPSNHDAHANWNYRDGVPKIVLMIHGLQTLFCRCDHRPENFGLRFSLKAWMPSA